jgi:hypothetical protein
MLAFVRSGTQGDSMQSISEATRAFFQADGWPYEEGDDPAVLELGFEGPNGSWTCYADCRDEARQLLFYSILDESAPGDRRPTMAEFLTRANYGLGIGNFELDFSDGEVRFKTSIDVGEAELDAEAIRRLTYLNVGTMNQYVPAIREVMEGKLSPEAAVAMAELDA